MADTAGLNMTAIATGACRCSVVSRHCQGKGLADVVHTLRTSWIAMPQRSNRQQQAHFVLWLPMAASAEGRAVPDGPLKESNPQVANAVQHINKATSDLTLNHHRA